MLTVLLKNIYDNISFLETRWLREPRINGFDCRVTKVFRAVVKQLLRFSFLPHLCDVPTLMVCVTQIGCANRSSS